MLYSSTQLQWPKNSAQNKKKVQISIFFISGIDFIPGEGVSHAWNAVFINGSWRLLDCTWGAGSYDLDGNFIREINEHFFLTDPDELIYSHFPYDEVNSLP